jgi:CubicO group peptidase (beta-lactamase class C family)
MTVDVDAITEAGLVPERVEALAERVRKEVDEGLLPSAQFAIAKDGKVVARGTFGDATDDTRYCIFSSTKAFSVSAFWTLLGEGKVSISDRVADILPGFGENGKEDVTVEHVMLHTAGFPNGIMGPPHWHDHESRLGVYPRWKLDWEPGTKFMYHATSAHWVLMDILTKITGTDHRDYIKKRVLEPLGLTSFALGIAPADQTNLAEISYVGEVMTPDEMEAAFGIREMPAPRGSLAAMGDFGLTLNESESREVGIPGGGGFSNAADVALFYQGLLHNGPSGKNGAIWDPEVLLDGTARVRNNLPDPLMGVTASRALGTVVAGDDGKAHMRGFGKTQSPRAFGHGGAGGQLAQADPETGVSFCYLTNGHDRHMIRQARRSVGIASRAGLLTV